MNIDQERTAAVYAKIPLIKCKGLCHAACGPIMASQAETRQLRRAGFRLDWNRKTLQCKHLAGNRCSIYMNRPAICRLYGVAEGMECPHGCEAERVLTRQEAGNMLRELDDLP